MTALRARLSRAVAKVRDAFAHVYITHNVYVGQDPASVGRNLRALTRFRRPLAVALQESRRFHGPVRGYRLLAAQDKTLTRDDSYRHNQLLVRRRGVKVRKVVPLKVPDGDWTYDGNHKEARVFLRVVLEVRGRVEEVWVIHRCPLGPNPPRDLNVKVWRREHEFIVDQVTGVLRRHPGRKITLLADWNTSEGKNPHHPCSIESLAEELGARIHMVHIDGALQINGPRCRVERLDGFYGSDHHRPVVVKEAVRT